MFFQTISNDTKKYHTVAFVLKIALSLPLGNADVERGLSVNNFIITKERNQLSEALVNGLRAKDAVKFYDPELMRPARNSHFDYQKRGELQKEKEEKDVKSVIYCFIC